MSTLPGAEHHIYQHWHGSLSSSRWTWWPIAATGVRLAMKSWWARSLVLSGGVLVVGNCVMFYVLSLLETLVGSREAADLYGFVRVFLGVDVSGISRVADIRELLWRGAFLLTIKAQSFWVFLVVAGVGPPLISRDLKMRALPIYFAKPVTPATYLLGKWTTVAVFVAAVMLIPNLLSVMAGTLLTGGLQTWQATADLTLDLLISGLGVCVLAGTIILALSSLSSDLRYVGGGWVVVCALLQGVQSVIDNTVPAEKARGLLGCVSLWDNGLVLTDWLFGMREAWAATGFPARVYEHALVKAVNPACAAGVVAAWVAASVLVCYRRVVRFSRSAANV